MKDYEQRGDETLASQTSDSRSPADWLVGGGEMAKVIKAMDWSKTAVGPITSWPQSLRTTLSLAQASNSPISIAWGPGHVQIYNDGYWPICGAKHPGSMGQDFRECWASTFPVIGEAYASAWSGTSAYLEKMRMFLDRYGFLEETWFTFSFSPITDESGGVGGLFHPVTEMTMPMLSERRTSTLRDLASRAGKARTTEEAFALSAQALATADRDLPFVLLYLVNADAGQARLVAQTGLPAGTRASPDTVDSENVGERPWPIGDVIRDGQPILIDNADERLRGLAVGPYPELPKMAFVLPIILPGSERPAAVMVAGASSRLRMNDSYRAFYDWVAAGISTALANARAYEEERHKAEALAAIDRAKTAFFSNISHEFRTPLTLILGPIEEALLSQPSLPLSGENLSAVHRNAVRLLRLVNSLLDFSRIEAGRLQSHFEPTDLATLTEGLSSAFQSLMESGGIRLVVMCPPLSEPVYVDRCHWEKIVLNLISNAFKFTFEGHVMVRLTEDASHVFLAVSDTGTGIPQEELPRIFERFHRVEGSRGRSFEGTGIGLALVDELCKAHGGSIRVESDVGRGSTFRVCIPKGSDHLPADRIARGPAAPVSLTSIPAAVLDASQWARPSLSERPLEPIAAAAPDGEANTQAKSRILVADDNADLRDHLTRLLRPYWDVETVDNGEAALSSALARPPDLVVSDVMMPIMDGVALLRALRAHSATESVPVILLSARAGEEAILEGLETGADDYLVKPFSARELTTRIRTHLSMARVRKTATDAATELAETRARLLRDLERKNSELEAFSYSVSHDLRAPLRTIDGFSQLLLEDYAALMDAEGRTFLTRIRGAAQRMGQLIDDLLKLSRVGRAELSVEPTCISELAGEVIDVLKRESPDRQVDVSIQPGLRSVCDPRLYRIVLENLLGNAWKFTSKSPSPRIELGEFNDPERTGFYVRDNGAGFDPAYSSKLFGAFQRLHLDGDFPGTGIGLATVARIVHRHGGDVWADGAVGRGATIHCALPRDTAGKRRGSDRPR